MLLRSLVLGVLCCVAFPAAVVADVPHARDGELKSMCRQINGYRAQHGIAPMTLSPALVTAAWWMSADMANKNYFSHTDSLGRSYSTRLALFGAGLWTAENIAAGTPDAQQIMIMWMNSGVHRANLLNAGYTVMGIGRAYNPNSTYDVYWVADFAASHLPGTIC